MCHIVAEVLTLPYDDVMTGDWGNMDVAADGGGQNGSTRSISVGAAFQRAAEDLRSQLLEAAVAQLGAQSSSQLELKNGAVYVIADQSKFRKISEICTLNAWPFVGRGYPWAQVLQRPVPGFDVGKPCEVRTHDAMVVEIAVDQETGEIEVLSHYNADDCGRVLFRAGAEGQIEGGTMMAHGRRCFTSKILDPGTVRH